MLGYASLLRSSPPQRFSHLYSSPGQVVGTFQRIDIPVLPQLVQYEFVLFTGRASRSRCAWIGLLCTGSCKPTLPLCMGRAALAAVRREAACCHRPRVEIVAAAAPSVPLTRAFIKPAADCDVYFRQRIQLVDWGTPLPQAVGMR